MTDKLTDSGGGGKDPWHKILEHEFRLDAFERLFANQEKVVDDLAKAVVRLENKLTAAINKLIVAIIVVALLGENAVPMLIGLAGGG